MIRVEAFVPSRLARHTLSRRSAPTPPSPPHRDRALTTSAINSACRANHRGMHDRVQLLDRCPPQTRSAPAPPDRGSRPPPPPLAQNVRQSRAYTACPGCIISRPISSAEKTYAPCAANICAMVDFPLPSPPVSPTRSTALHSARNMVHNRASPSFGCLHRVVHQHRNRQRSHTPRNRRVRSR